MHYPSSNSRRLKAAMAAAAGATLAAGMAEAAVVGINFRGSGYGAAGANVTATAYGVGVADWTNSPDNETGTTFTASTISVTWTATNDWNEDITPVAGNGEVNYGYIDDSDDIQSVTLSGLSAWLIANGATGYTIQLIQASDNATGFVATSLFSSNGGTALGSITNPGTNPLGGVYASASNLSGVLTSDTLYLKPGDRAGDDRGTIAGIVITAVPEPSIALLSGLGLLGLVRRRR